jgi:hypothetical protein
MLGFIVRLVGYALLLGVSSRIAQTLWSNDGLDAVAVLQPLHDAGVLALVIAPLALALIGIGRARPLAVFVAFALAGAAVAAPFACARVAGG